MTYYCLQSTLQLSERDGRRNRVVSRLLQTLAPEDAELLCLQSIVFVLS